jgi:integrase
MNKQVAITYDTELQKLVVRCPYWANDLIKLIPSVRWNKTRKAWVITKGKDRKRIKLGLYPQLSLAEARKRALVALGTDTEEAPKLPTFPEARDQYLAQGTWRPRSRYEITRTLNKHFHWSKPIDQITHRDVSEAIDAIAAKSEAAHAFKDIRAFFNFCVPRYLKSSPCTGLKPPSRYVPRSRVLSDEELIKVWRACESQGNFGVIMRLCFLTAARRSEIVGAKTFTDNTVTFLETKNGKDHVLPITPYIRSLFYQVQPLISWGKPKARLDKISGVTGYCIHDARRTTSTNLGRLNTDPFLIERILNHSMPSLQRTYNRHAYVEAMREPIERHQQWLFDLVGNQD